MLLLRLWNYIRGYVIIVVEGYFLEKFINICIHRQVFLWDIKKQNNCTMTLKVSINGFKMLRPIARKTGCRVRIYRKKGLPFLLNRYKGRKTFVIGAVLFVLLIYILSSFVWTIEITGNKKLDTRVILDSLAAEGIKPGVLKYGIDTEKAVNSLMLDVKELAWVGMVVKGTKVKLSVVERVNPPELVPKDAPCDIVAGRDGMIKSIFVKAGEGAVKAGDTVTKGQVLISGTVPSKNQEVKERLVHAMGTVKARTWYEGSAPVEFRTYEKQRTGKVKDNYWLVLFTRKIGLFPGKVPFEDYDKVEVKKSVSLGEDTVLPFELVVDRYYENSLVEKEVSLDDAKQAASDAAYKKAMEDIPEDAEIVKTNIDFVQKEEEGLTANVVVECMEEIGVAKEIGGK